MNTKKNSIQSTIYLLLLLAAILVLFQWYTLQNLMRIQNQNLNYAVDTAQQKAIHLESELDNALNRISTYAHFLGESLTEPLVTPTMLAQMEANSLFDAFRYTDTKGVNITSDGQTADESSREYFLSGIKGESGSSVLYHAGISGKAMINFYAPIYYKGEIAGVLQGAYYAKQYLQTMLASSHFGEDINVYLCTKSGDSIASSDGVIHEGNLLNLLFLNGVIDKETAAAAEKSLDKGEACAFICDDESSANNICIIPLPKSDYVLIQTFPQNITQSMIGAANRTGMMLEALLIGFFVLYILLLMIQERKEKRRLKELNREFSYVISSVKTLFTRFILADFEEDTYQYLAGTSPERDGFAPRGRYEAFARHMCSYLAEEEDRNKFALLFDKEKIISAMGETESDLLHEYPVTRNGSREWEHLNIICVERKNGKASKVLFLRQNITELKEKELRIQAHISLADRKERQYRVAISSDSICTYDFNLTQDRIDQDILCQVGGQAYSLLQETGLQVPCRASDWFSLRKPFITEESLEEYSQIITVDQLQKCFDDGCLEVTMEYGSRFPAGRTLRIRQTFIMTKDDSTGDVMVMVVTKDITEQVRKQMEQTQALKEALMQAQHASHAKSTFLSNMSHDIRTPMNAIIGFSMIALNHIESRAQVKDCLQKVLSSSNHLLSLINDILDMSRIESGKVQIKEQECNISEQMHNLVNIIQPQVKAKQLDLFIDIFDIVNEDIIADSLKMNQIFLNLMSNAVKYTPAGGAIRLQISQKTVFRRGYGDYVFTIKDNGIGMDPEFVKHIFEPFEREASATQSGIQGTGLGMAITKNIVDMMNGKITVKSEKGRGSEFTVELSLKLQDVQKTQEQVAQLKGIRVLVVDDDKDACKGVSKMLQQLEIRSQWTTSGREAVEMSEKAYQEGDPYHTYFVDWQMPVLSGVETTRQLRSIAGDQVPIIILTAYDWSDIESEAREAGVSAFCAKPLFLSDLKSVLLASSHLVETEEEAPSWTSADFSGKRVLLVDDIETNREIAEEILSEIGVEVEHAPDGTDAVAMVKDAGENYYDAVLMDVQMPIMNGYEATRHIRALPRNDVRKLPIIAMTANAMEEDKEAALKSGMNAHIAKPFNIDEFVAVLGKYLQ